MNKLKLPIVPEQRDETEVKRITCVFFFACVKNKENDFIPFEVRAWFAQTKAMTNRTLL